jgi:glutathione S-transferase
MKLYMHPASPNCMSVLMTAIHSGIPLESEFVDLMASAQNDPGYLAINPNGKVPTLIDGDLVLWESNAIMQYIAAMKPANSLWPDDGRVRADIARWQFWSIAHWTPALRPFLWENLFKGLRGQGGPDAGALEMAQQTYCQCAGVLDGHLASRARLVDEELTLADISCAAYLMYAEPARIPLQHYANIWRWFSAIQSLPSWQQVQPRQPLKPAAKARELDTAAS